MNFEIWGLEYLPKDRASYYRFWVKEKLTLQIEDPAQVNEHWVVNETRELLYSPENLPSFLRVWTENNNILEQCLIAVQEPKIETRGFLWLPTAKFRPGSQVRGFALHRDIHQNNIELSRHPLILTLLDPTGLERRTLEIKAQHHVSVFQLEISDHDPTGEWKLLLKQSDQLIDEAKFQVLRFEKPEIEIQHEISTWFLKGFQQQQSMNVRYFFGEPVEQLKQLKLTRYQILKSGEKRQVSEVIQENLELPAGLLTLDWDCREAGDYEWQLEIQDPQARTASIQGNYQVVTESLTLNIKTNSPFSPLKPDTPIQIEINLTNPVGNPLQNIPLQLEIEGDEECWEFLAPPHLITDANGKVCFTLKFKEIDDVTHFYLLVSATVDGMKKAMRETLKVIPLTSQELWLEASYNQAVYHGSEVVSVEIQINGRPDLVQQLTRGSAEIIGDVVVRSLDFSVASGKGQISFKLPKKITTPLNLKLRILREFPEFIERTLAIPLQQILDNSDSSLWHAVTEGVKQVATGEPMQIRVNFPQPLTENAKVFAWLIDRRIPRGTQEQNLGSRFIRQSTPAELKQFLPVKIEDWLNIQKKAKTTEIQLSKASWYTWSYVDESRQGKLIVIRPEQNSQKPTNGNWLKNLVQLAENKVLKNSLSESEVNSLKEKDQFIKTLLSQAYSSQDATAILQCFPEIAEFQIYKIEFYGDIQCESQWVKSPQSPTPIEGELRTKLNQLLQHPQFPPVRRARGLGMPMMGMPEDAVFEEMEPPMMLPFAPQMTAFSGSMALKSERDLDNVLEESGENSFSISTAHPIIREDFIEVECFEPIEVDHGSNYAMVCFNGSDAITEYDVVIFIIGTSSFGTATHRITVRNPLFTTIKNPPEMIWGDQSTLSTIVQNLSNHEFNEITLKLQTEKIQAFLPQQVITTLAAKQSILVNWAIEAVEVGNAEVLLSVETPNFQELSQLDTPLRVQPPGEPEIQRYTAALSQKKSLEWTFELSGDEVFTLGILSLMPNAQAAAIEGAEALAVYPYGCCEQTYASTLPNFILYRYLERRNQLSPSLRQKLIKNLESGRERYLTIFRNAKSGGFGLWSGKQTSTFHTALAFSILGLMSSVVEVEQKVLDGAMNYLLKARSESGSWQPQASLETPFPSTLSEAGNTAFIFHSASLANVILPETLTWLKHNVSSYQQDNTCVALVLDALTRIDVYRQAETALMTQLKEILLTTQQSKGSWVGQSSLTGAIETTAYCMIALGHAFPEDMAVRKSLKQGVDYLLENRRSTGWYSTRDTLYASWAIAETGHLAWTASDVTGQVEISLNNQLIQQFNFSQINEIEQLDLLYQMRRLYLEHFKPGINQVSLTALGAFTAHALLEVHTYHRPRPSSTPPRQEIGALQLHWSQQELIPGETTELTLAFAPNQPLEALLIEIPIPAGVAFNLAEDLIEKPSQFDHVELNHNKVALFASNLNRQVQIKARFHPELPGEVQVNPVRIYPMYQPDLMTLSDATKLVVKQP